MSVGAGRVRVEVMPMPSTRPYHLAAGEGPALWHLGALLTFKATSDNTNERLWVQEAYGARGYASPLHRHRRAARGEGIGLAGPCDPPGMQRLPSDDLDRSGCSRLCQRS